jgi:hypothetical protein
MVCLRRSLQRIAVTWLLCQAATLTLAPALLWFGSTEELLECTCIHGDHAICPMHHKTAPGSKICLMRGSHDSSVAVFSWLSNIGLVPAPTTALMAEHRPVSHPLEVSAPSFRSTPPDPPPPRS